MARSVYLIWIVALLAVCALCVYPPIISGLHYQGMSLPLEHNFAWWWSIDHRIAVDITRLVMGLIVVCALAGVLTLSVFFSRK